MCELLVGLPAVRVRGIVDEADGPLFVHIETAGTRPRCLQCATPATVKDRDRVELVDLAAFGRRTRLSCGTSIAGCAATGRVRCGRGPATIGALPRHVWR